MDNAWLKTVQTAGVAAGIMLFSLHSPIVSGQTKSSKGLEATVSTQEVKSVIYKDVEVNPLKKFPNAKLVGVADRDIQFYDVKGNVVTYNAKGLLFELDSSKLVNLVGPDLSFYIGQRYDISYHIFKSGVTVKTPSILSMFMDNITFGGMALTQHYNGRYDGVLVDSKLNRRDR